MSSVTADALAELSRLATAAVAIARRAGAEIMDVYGSGDFGETTKSDDSPLTQADLRAHRAIVAGLEALSPALPVLSEESVEIPYETRRQWSRYWLVDPLDGTKEFLSRNGEFTVNIALIDNQEAVLGVVYVPARDTMYWGVVGQGAHRQDSQGVTAIHAQSTTSTPVRVVGSRSHRGDSLDAFLDKIGPYELIPVGSALKLCMVAEGSADVYPRLGLTSEWDTAAAHAVVSAAGGTVVQADGSALRYNAKENILNPYFLVYADGTRDWVSMLR